MAAILDPAEGPAAKGRLRRAGAYGLGGAGSALAAAVVLVALVGPLVAPASPTEFVGIPFQRPSATAWLGTDILGRDVLSRVLCGGSGTLGLAAAATLLGVVGGGLLGLAAGYVKGMADEIIMRLLDVALAFPQTVLALLFVSLLGSAPWLIVLVVAAIHAPQVARVARTAALAVAEEDFVRFAEAIGMARAKIMVSEISPNILGPLLVELGLRFTYSIAIIAGLSFLGFGPQPPTPDWGLMINENRIGLASNPWPVAVPILLIAALTIGTNLLTESVARAALGRGEVAGAALAGAKDAAKAGEIRA